MDNRIGPNFLKASVGFGGSCFQKDILNIVYLCKYYGLNEVAEYWHQVVKINNYQKERFAEKVIDHLGGNLSEKKILILGWAFKANTNDSRESASIKVSEVLYENGANLELYDPMVSDKTIFNDIKDYWTKNNIEFDQRFKILSDLDIVKYDAVLVLTEWDEFKSLNWDKIASQIPVFDGRLIIEEKHKNIFKIGKRG